MSEQAMPAVLLYRTLTLILIGMLSGLFGCAHQEVMVPARPAPLSEHARAQLGTVGVASAPFAPEARVEVRVPGERSGDRDGAAAGGVAGSAVGASGAGAILPLATWFPPAYILAGGIFVLSSVGGALLGNATDSDPADTTSSTEGPEAAFKTALASPVVKKGMRAHILYAADELPSYRVVLLDESPKVTSQEHCGYHALTERGVDSLLIVEAEKVTLTIEQDVHTPMALDLAVRSTLIRTTDGEKIDERLFTCREGTRTLPQWRAESDTPFMAGLSRCYQKVADRIMEELFLVYDPPIGRRWSFGGAHFATVALDSLQPTLTWEPFTPMADTAQAQHGLMSRVEHVKYDLKVWRANSHDLPSDLVYARNGLASLSHEMEDALEPDTTYFWTVRARFDVDGRTRVTPWAVTQVRTGYSSEQFDRVTNDFYYRFKTPSLEPLQG